MARMAHLSTPFSPQYRMLHVSNKLQAKYAQGPWHVWQHAWGCQLGQIPLGRNLGASLQRTCVVWSLAILFIL